jgi:hypothetical protein
VKNIIFIIYTALFLAACGGSSSSTTNTPNNSDNSESVSKIGVFIDAPVKGLVYVSSPSGKEGVTNEKGEFEYIDGDTVSFNMGSIELGKAVPDKDKNVKVTQLKEALLVAQLLQVLDADADENKIDVSDIIIPEVIQKVIVEKLKRTENQTEDNIISKEQFEAIKQKNPKKLTLQQRTEVISKNKVLEHVKQQIGESDLRFSASELKSLILIEASLLNNFDGITIGFSDENSPAIQIDVKNNLVAKSISAKMSRSEWEIDSKGNLVVGPSGSACVVSKIAEDSDVMDVSYSCVDEKNNLGLSRLVKPQPLSANDLSDKSFNFTSPSGNKETLTFRNDGALNCNGENSSCTYKTHPIHKNAVWIQGGGDNSDENTLMILAQGSLAKGKLLIIHYDAQYNLDSVEVIKVSGNTLKQVFESADNDESSELNNNTDDNSDSNDNSESDKQNNEIEEAKEEAKEIEDPKEDDNEGTDNDSDSQTQNPNYIPFTQEMISGKTLYNVYIDREDEDKDGNKTEWMAVTFSFDESSNSGEGLFGIHESITKADASFNYSINDKGYLILSNVTFTNPEDDPDDGHNMDAIALIEDTGDSFKLCWRKELDQGCNDEEQFFYKTKEAAEAFLAFKALPKSTYSHSGSGIQNPTYMPFTQEMLVGKKFFSATNEDDDPDFTLIFEVKGAALWFHLANLPDKPTPDTPKPDSLFDYMIDSRGFIIISNVEEKSDRTDDNPAIGLLRMKNNSLIVCWGESASEIANFCSIDNQNTWHLSKEAAEAEKIARTELMENDKESIKHSEPVPYIPFPQEILSGKTFYDVGKDEKLTLFFGDDNMGHLWSGLTDSTTSPDLEFDYRVDSEGFIVLSNVFSNGSRSDDTPMIIGLLGKGVRGHSLVTCWGKSASEVADFCGEDNKHVWYFTKEMAEAEVRAHGTVKDDDPKPIPVTYIPFTQGMLSGQTLYGVGNDLDVTINFDADNTGHAATHIAVGTHIPVGTDYDYITFDYLIDSHGLLILQNTKINGRDQTDTILGLIESSDGLKVCWGDEFMYKNKTSGFCMDEDIVALYRTKQLALNAQLKRDLPPSEKDKENTDKNSDSSMQTPTYIPFRQEMLSGKILYVPSEKLPLTMYYGDNNKGHGQISISNDNDYVMEEYPFVTFDYHIDSDGFLIYSDVSITDDRSTIGLIESSDKTLKVCWDDEQSYDINDFCKDEDLMTFYTNYIEAEVAQLSKDNQAYLEEVKTRTSIPFTQDMLSGKHFYDIHFGPKYHEMTLFFDADQTGKGVNGLHEQIEDEDMTFDYTIDKDGHLTLSNIKILRNSILYFVDITDVTYQYSIALNKDMHGQLLVCWGKSKSELVHPYGCMHGGQLKYLYKTVESAKEALENQ